MKKIGCMMTVGLLFALVLVGYTLTVVSAPVSAAEPGFVSLPPQAASAPAVASPAASGPSAIVLAASGATIPFKAQNGGGASDASAQTLTLPHLVLYRNSALTGPAERTLIVQVNGVEPSSEVTLEIKTQHMDLSSGNPQFITVWQESKSSGDAGAVTFACEFTEQVTSGDMAGQATPTDYFEVTIGVNGQPIPDYGPRRYAFLMENQELVGLPDLAREGATPNELIVYYCDMFPFGWGKGQMLNRNAVPNYVRNRLIPEMIKATVTQTNVWGMGPWHAGWNGRRRGENGEYEKRLSMALGLNGEWYHGPGTEGKVGGHDFITIKAARFEPAYADLLDMHMSVFFHELFHNLQRNVGSVVSWDEAFTTSGSPWQFFSEGQAVMATSVGQPGAEFAAVLDYVKQANDFLKDELNTSYLSADPTRPYRTAIYWRFLYEQCGGMSQGSGENPAAGIQVVKRSLERLFSDMGTASTGFVESMDRIMDQVFASGACPAFGTYEESVIAFARAIYTLQLEGGRCTGSGAPECGFYDPNALYRNPPVDVIRYAGGTLTYAAADQASPAGIKSSFGMDFVDVVLDPAADGQPLTLEFHGAPGAGAVFHVEVWKLMDLGEGTKPQRVMVPEPLVNTNADGSLSYTIPIIDTRTHNRLGLIITRVDANEGSDPVGAYTIVLHAGGDGN